jgi:RND superfamily putative drug exporter
MPAAAAASEPVHDPLHRFFAALGRFSVRFRWAIVAAWLVAAVVVTAAFPTLASVTKANNTSFLPGNVPSERASDLASPLQKANLVPVAVVAVTDGRQLDAADEAAIARVVGVLRHVSTVRSVRDLGRSPDGQAEQLLVLSNIPVGGSQASISLVDDMETAVHAVATPAGLSVHLAGETASQVASQGKNSGNAVQGLSVLFILVLLFLIFRAVLAPFVTLLPAFLVVVVAGPVIAELSKAGLQVSTLSQLLLIVLVLGAGTDYGLFLVFRVREEIRGGRDPKEAVAYSVSRVGESISFSAGTVIAALLSLLLATFGLYQSLGAPLAIGIGFMLLAGLTLQPALLAIFGRAVFWPSRPRAGDTRTGVWGRVAARVVSAPTLTLVIGLVLFGALAFASTGNKPAGFGNALSAPSGTDEAAGNAALAKHFPAAAVNPTNLVFRTRRSVWSDPGVLLKADRELSASPLFTKVSGPLNPLGAQLTPADLLALHAKLGPASALSPAPPADLSVPVGAYEAYRATSSYLSTDGRTFQFETSLAAGDPSTTKALQAVPSIRAETTAVATSIGAAQWGVAGEAPGIYDVNAVSNHDLVRVIPVAILIIAVLLAAVMRSLVAPLYLIASVALSYFAALGLAVVLFIYLGGSGGLTFILPFLMFIFLLALGEDYNILVMTRIREEARIYPLRTAVARAITATGSTVTSAGMVLAGTFAVFAIVGGRSSGGSQIEDVGAGLALGVLMDTFLVRTLLVPSTVSLLGRWNWWPSTIEPPGPPPAGPPSADPTAQSPPVATPG